ncbi:MAG: bifunctional hydroxymethylpyrimidine kinase/phosphomethylpyrimidine kinase [Bacteroidetes bacterium]|nr:MAG: bifunctional hydroxymethylpyrimidine kinase/phosphomethylpyrimidine kinase [Bacteroidota bacterium]
MTTIPVCLTIAGSDSGGGAGIQADIKAMQANGVFAASVITAITAQNTVAVTDALDLPVSIIEAQFDAVTSDMDVAATKTGMLSSIKIIEAVASRLAATDVGPVVVDPVMISKSGFKLLKDDAIDVLKSLMLPLAAVVTPNAHEAALLVGRPVRDVKQARDAAQRIYDMGPKAVLVKGGHLDDEEDAIDVLYDGSEFLILRTPRLDTKHTHGTGCTYAASLAANLAKGYNLHESAKRSKRYVMEAIRGGFQIGNGHGPTDHFFFLRDRHEFPTD